MSIKSIILTVTLTSVGLSQSLKEQIVIWQGAYRGMSLTQLSQTFPDAKSSGQIVSDKKSDLVEMLRIDSFPIVSENFTVRFLFNKQTEIQKSGLCQVQFVLNRSDVNYDTAITIFRKISEVLTVKYGRSISYNEDGEHTLLGVFQSGEASGTWTNGNTSVVVNFHTIFSGSTGQRSIFTLTYGTELIQESNKL